MTESSHLAARIREVSDAIRSQADVAVPKQTITRLVWAVVVAVNASPPTIDVAPGGVTDGTKWSQVSYEGWYKPVVNDSVLVMVDGTDRICIGTMGEAGGGMSLAVAYGILGPVPAQILPGPFIPSPGNQKVYVVGARGKMSSGSLTMDVTVEGTVVPGLTGLSVAGVNSWTCTPYLINNNYQLYGVTSSPSGDGDLSFSVYTRVV